MNAKETEAYYEQLNSLLNSTPGAYRYLTFLQESMEYGLIGHDTAVKLIHKYMTMKNTKWGKKNCSK